MFKNLFDIWRGNDFINKVHADFAEMLNLAERMYKETQWYIFVEENNVDIQEEIYAMDREINQLERKIRTRVLEHLVLQPSVDISASLVMLNVTKNAERLGDYIKNVSEARVILNGPVNQEKYQELLGSIDEKILEMFVSTKQAFMTSDENQAEIVGNTKKELATKCEEIIQNISSSKMKVREAVGYALLARYYKRIISHLGNIATTVILPFSDIGYYSFRETHKRNIILGLCTENSCRSQLFEAILKHLGGDKFKVVSAGIKITNVHPLVSKVLSEINITMNGQFSKKIELISMERDVVVLVDEKGKKIECKLSEVNSVITLCGEASESCPMFPGKVHREHWPIKDPKKMQGTDEEILPYFRIARDDIYARVQEFLAGVKSSLV